MPGDGSAPTLEGLRAWMEPLIARYKIPRELVLVAQLPRTPSGKVTKHVLQAELAD